MSKTENFDPRLRVNYRTDTIRDDNQSFYDVNEFKKIKQQLPAYDDYANIYVPPSWQANNQLLQNDYNNTEGKQRVDCQGRILKGADTYPSGVDVFKRQIMTMNGDNTTHEYQTTANAAYQYSYDGQSDVYYNVEDAPRKNYGGPALEPQSFLEKSPQKDTFTNRPQKDTFTNSQKINHFDPLGLKSHFENSESAAHYDQINRSITFNDPVKFNVGGPTTRTYNSTAQYAYDPSIPSDGIDDKTNLPKPWVDQ